MSVAHYQGTELDVFSQARHWKSYWCGRIAQYIHGSVLEVGAGIGANTATMAALPFRSWLCLEPDPQLARRMNPPSGRHRVMVGTIADLSRGGFDAILYLDVLEHIGDDRGEMRRAAALLNPGGSLIVLSPAHSCLFSPFDEAVGHFRRYDRKSLRAAAPPGLHECNMEYLDSCGLLASLGNRLFLESANPTLRQIQTWDRWLVPFSRCLDRLSFGRVGKSILGVWTAPCPRLP